MELGDFSEKRTSRVGLLSGGSNLGGVTLGVDFNFLQRTTGWPTRWSETEANPINGELQKSEENILLNNSNITNCEKEHTGRSKTL